MTQFFVSWNIFCSNVWKNIKYIEVVFPNIGHEVRLARSDRQRSGKPTALDVLAFSKPWKNEWVQAQPVSKDWKKERKGFQTLEKRSKLFPNLGKRPGFCLFYFPNLGTFDLNFSNHWKKPSNLNTVFSKGWKDC